VSATERTGWRDQEISARHRRWGFNCPAVDVDFMLIEYDEGIPVAIIDYKLGLQREVEPTAANHRAQQNLYVKANHQYIPVPHYIVTYETQPAWRFRIRAVGVYALIYMKVAGGTELRTLSESEYVAWLYEMRSQQRRRREQRVIA